MADFIFLFRGGDDQNLRQSPEKWQAHMQEWMAWMKPLSDQGKLGGAEPLKPGGKIVKGKNKTLTDGPFMEGKEMIGGYLICKAANYEEAVEISKGCPILAFDNGVVEIREIELMEA